MGFAVFKKTYPRRCWGLRGYATEGKSTLAARMRGPLLLVDTDGRFNEVVTKLDLPDDAALSISETQSDHSDPYRIQELLQQNQGQAIGTILVDSITGILQPRIVAAMHTVSEAKLRNKTINKSAVWMDKAMSMRAIIDPVQNYGCDFLLLWHKEDGRDGSGQEATRETISRTEMDRLYRALNIELEMVTERNKAGVVERFGVKVVWARMGRSGIVLWDEPGNYWRGMPERIEQEVYGRNFEHMRAGVDKPVPFPAAPETPNVSTNVSAGASSGQADEDTTFASMREALVWAIDTKKAFGAYDHAKEAYSNLKRDLAALHDPLTPDIVYSEWRKLVHAKALAPAAAV